MSNSTSAARSVDWAALVERATVPAWIVDDHSYRFHAVSRPALRLYGYSKQEFLGLTALDIRPADEVPRLLRTVSQLNPAGTAGHWTHRSKDGTTFDVHIAYRKIQFNGHEALVIFVTAVDGEPTGAETVPEA